MNNEYLRLKNESLMISIFCGVLGVVFLFYGVSVAAIVSSVKGDAMEIVGFSIGAGIVSLLGIVVNSIYYGKRTDMFVN